MTNKHGIVEARRVQDIDLLLAAHNGKDLAFAKFGTDYYSKNVVAMSQHYRHFSSFGSFHNLTFRPATTSESISAVAPIFEFERKQMNSFRALQVGMVVKTDEGVYINPPLGANYNKTPRSGLRQLMDWFSGVEELPADALLKQLRDKAKSCNGIRLGENDFAFVPYEALIEGKQDAGEFAESGLARGLEHTESRHAPILTSMVLAYDGVDVDYFHCPGFDTVLIYPYEKRLHILGGSALRRNGAHGWPNNQGFIIGLSDIRTMAEGAKPNPAQAAEWDREPQV